MSNNDYDFSIENLQSNLKKAPYLCSFVGYDNIIDKAKSNIKKDSSNEKNLCLNNLGRIAFTFGIRKNAYQPYIESLFKTLSDHQIKYPNPTKKFKKDVLNPDQDDSTLSEIEVAAKLAPCFKITPEYLISESKSNLDLLIEDKTTGEKALIEIATTSYDYDKHDDPEEEASIRFIAGKGSKAYKINNALDAKLKKQFKDCIKEVEKGKTPLEYPLIILINNETPYGMDSFFTKIEDPFGLYEKEWSRTDHEGNVHYRQGGFFHKENIEFICKIGIYKLEYLSGGKYKLVGRFYNPEPIKTPQRKMSSEFEQKILNVLFDSLTE